MTSGVILRGRGVAVSTAAHLLRRAGLALECETGTRRAVPVIMLSDPALALLRDVFGKPGLFADRVRIERRVVRWGTGEPVAMPHGAIVVSEDDLTDVLEMLPQLNVPPSNNFKALMTLHGQSPFPAAPMQRFGERLSATARVRLADEAAPATCWIESVDYGWLFLISDGSGGAWLLAVGGAPEALAAQAPMIAPLIESMEPASATFDTSPRMVEQLAGEGWLALGTAAIAFDPICGDGTAQAVREAILAGAVVTAVARGEDPDALQTHYQSMLLAAMRRHLQMSLPFYGGAGSAPWWREQYAASRAGYDWCTQRLSAMPEPRFALHGFDLVRRGLAA
ncbi:hypothetical protein [Novosphingobium sp. MMS21-SN21R]|uniref:hypothetical protein n=1 Tax=Novosphingobium sp. MMS21-SN21R TaxID=2969298 RepID=UPI002888D2F5|nr:hypothetical protein [Novosphingobium sp. MMS21-SN21R]MDT0506910.1 hypothetical protein [Novosphingobium sp. MMS21-SN21R]